MRNAFIIEHAIYAMLLDSQDSETELPFSLDASATLYNYNPGDVRVVPYLPEDGLYIFFDKTEFDPSIWTVGEQEHLPRFKAYLYTSRGADADKTSMEACHAAAEELMASLYECLCHTEFKRLLRTRVQLLVDGLVVPKIKVSSVQNVLTYATVGESTRAVSFWELVGEWQNVETPGENAGVTLLGITDRLRAVRETGDIEGDVLVPPEGDTGASEL